MLKIKNKTVLPFYNCCLFCVAFIYVAFFIVAFLHIAFLKCCFFAPPPILPYDNNNLYDGLITDQEKGCPFSRRLMSN